MMTDEWSAESTTHVSRRNFLVASGSAGTAALAGCLGSGSGGSGLSGEVNVAGSSTVYPISQAMSEEFKKKHSNVNVPVSKTGTGAGFSEYFCKGKTDINNASRPISEEEKQLCQENGIEPVEFQIATDALTVIANPNADWVDCLTFEELRRIWGPENPATKWSDVRSDWPDEDLKLYGAASTSGTFDFFTETVMGEEGSHRSDYQGTEKDNTIVNAVKGDKHAMGYFGFSYYDANRDSLKGLSIEKSGSGCTEPSFQTAKNGNYPLSRPLFIYVNKSSLEREPVRRFTDYYLQQSSSDMIKQIGYVPLSDGKKQENLNKLESTAPGSS